ncbi:hypothetical protein AVEN_38489-1 [Araneus ventricosus]|uniref:Uncharacterized protein n=1 Tax=Araneus ventricosus TaxID=182803 RepID=A0A4Y2JCP1_ARAVE|nr:hypothetical protein AVEN_38489-1 [Araneus ventricosus]
MKPFLLKYERKQETDDGKEENVLLMGESEDEDFGWVDFSRNMFVLIDNVADARMKAHYLYVCGIQEVDSGEYAMTGLITINLSKSKLVSVVNDQFSISESQLKAIFTDCIFEVDCRKELFGFQVL